MNKNFLFAKVITAALFAALSLPAMGQTVKYVTYFPAPHAYYTLLNVSYTALLATHGMREYERLVPAHARSGIIQVGDGLTTANPKLQATVNPPGDWGNRPDPYTLSYSAFYNLTIETLSSPAAQLISSLHVGASVGNAMAGNPPGVYGNMGNVHAGHTASRPFLPTPAAMPTAANIIADGTLRVYNLVWGSGQTDYNNLNNNTALMGGIGTGVTGNPTNNSTGTLGYSFGTASGVSTTHGVCNITEQNRCCALQWRTLKIRNTSQYRTYLTCNENCTGGC